MFRPLSIRPSSGLARGTTEEELTMLPIINIVLRLRVRTRSRLYLRDLTVYYKFKNYHEGVTSGLHKKYTEIQKVYIHNKHHLWEVCTLPSRDICVTWNLMVYLYIN